MQLQFHPSVLKFLKGLHASEAGDLYALIELLEKYGAQLSMPYAKPLGGGLWELRATGRPSFRVLYAFCEGRGILLLALKKQKTALRPQEIALAHKRLRAYGA